MLLQITSDKVFTAFLGAAVALLLKFIYDSFTEYNRLNDIRNMIRLDLELQKQFLSFLVVECDAIITHINGDDEPVVLIQSNLISTDIFKAHSAKDYFKAFNKSDYQTITLLYRTIEQLSKTVLKDEFDEYVAKANVCSDEDFEKINEEYIETFELYKEKCKSMIKYIDAQLRDYNKEFSLY